MSKFRDKGTIPRLARNSVARGKLWAIEMRTVCIFRKTIGELCEDMEVVRSTDSTFGNLEMTFKLNKVSVLGVFIDWSVLYTFY